MVVFNISCFVYSRQGAFRGSGNARLRGRAECFRAVFGYKPAGAPYPPFPLKKKARKKRNKRRRKPRKRAKKNISVKLKYQFISLPKRKVKAPKEKAQNSKHIAIAISQKWEKRGKLCFLSLCVWVSL